MKTKYLVKTDHGDVLVEVNEACRNALDGDLLRLNRATPENAGELKLEVPLRAFSATMLEIIEAVGTGDFRAEPKVVELLKKERATEELTRIERWARDNAGVGG